MAGIVAALEHWADVAEERGHTDDLDFGRTSLIRGMRRALSEDEQHKVAGAIVEHLESTNWRIEQGPPREGHSRLMGK